MSSSKKNTTRKKTRDKERSTYHPSEVLTPCSPTPLIHSRNNPRPLERKEKNHPTLPSSLMFISWLTSAANSIGSSLKTSLQKPLMIIDTASSGSIPRCWK